MRFPKSAALKGPGNVFDAELGAKVWRAIDLHEKDRLDGAALRVLFREAVAYDRDHPQTSSVMPGLTALES